MDCFVAGLISLVLIGLVIKHWQTILGVVCLCLLIIAGQLFIQHWRTLIVCVVVVGGGWILVKRLQCAGHGTAGADKDPPRIHHRPSQYHSEATETHLEKIMDENAWLRRQAERKRQQAELAAASAAALNVVGVRWNRVGLTLRQDVHGNFHEYLTRYDEDEKGQARSWAESRILR
eukprot:SAG31_NODE_32_length_32319_cov_28.042681_7_plen_176_part_00